MSPLSPKRARSATKQARCPLQACDIPEQTGLEAEHHPPMAARPGMEQGHNRLRKCTSPPTALFYFYYR